MPRILTIDELQERKRALIWESDVYRESLKLQLQNVTYCLAQSRQRFTGFAPGGPLLSLISPLLGSFLKGGGFPGMRVVTGALFAWKMLRKLRFILGLFRRKKTRIKQCEAEADAPV